MSHSALWPHLLLHDHSHFHQLSIDPYYFVTRTLQYGYNFRLSLNIFNLLHHAHMLILVLLRTIDCHSTYLIKTQVSCLSSTNLHNLVHTCLSLLCMSFQLSSLNHIVNKYLWGSRSYAMAEYVTLNETLPLSS